MKHLIISDIFGLTPSLLTLAKSLNHAEIVDPYDGEMKSFSQEDEAYLYFVEHCGHDKYLERLSDALNQQKSINSIIGFSAGATALWRYIARPDARTFTHIHCFYSGQIRHYLTLKPQQAVKLIFPSVEQHFDVQQVITELSGNGEITIEQNAYQHGFMNPCSTHFDQQAYQYYLHQLQQLK